MDEAIANGPIEMYRRTARARRAQDLEAASGALGAPAHRLFGEERRARYAFFLGLFASMPLGLAALWVVKELSDT